MFVLSLCDVPPVSGHGECIPFNENNQKYMLGGTMRDRLAAFGVDIDKVMIMGMMVMVMVVIMLVVMVHS